MAPANSAAKGGLVWIVLVVVMAIPGFLFFNWWSHLKAEHDRGATGKARARVSDGHLFQTAPASGRLVNPIGVSSAAVSATSVPSPAPTKTAVVAKSGPAAAATSHAPVPMALGSGAAAEPSVVAATTAVNAVGAKTPGAIISTTPAVPSAVAPAASVQLMASTVTVVLSRDPMLSPMDAVRLREMELERIRNEAAMKRELDQRDHPRARQHHKETPIEKHIELQGIVAKPGGAGLAIINGATVSSGELFSVRGYPGKVKIIRISAEEVVMEYKARKIRKRVNVE